MDAASRTHCKKKKKKKKKKMKEKKFFIRNVFSDCDQILSGYLVTSTEEILSGKFHICAVTGLNALKTATKKVTHKAAEVTGKFIENIIASKIVNRKHVPETNSANVEEMLIPPEKRE